jgi:hypothetical protein
MWSLAPFVPLAVLVVALAVHETWAALRRRRIARIVLGRER